MSFKRFFVSYCGFTHSTYTYEILLTNSYRTFGVLFSILSREYVQMLSCLERRSADRSIDRSAGCSLARSLYKVKNGNEFDIEKTGGKALHIDEMKSISYSYAEYSFFFHSFHFIRFQCDSSVLIFSSISESDKNKTDKNSKRKTKYI